MRIVIKDTRVDTGKWTADYIWNKIEAFGPTAEKPFIMGLPTGSSPMPVYEEWIRRYKAGEISFKNVVTFNMDEYVNLPEDHSESYHSFMYNNLFNHIDIPPENITVGDSLTRIISIQALGLLGSALPPLNIKDINGFKQYPDQPSTESTEHEAGVHNQHVIIAGFGRLHYPK